MRPIKCPVTRSMTALCPYPRSCQTCSNQAACSRVLATVSESPPDVARHARVGVYLRQLFRPVWAERHQLEALRFEDHVLSLAGPHRASETSRLSLPASGTSSHQRGDCAPPPPETGCW